MLLVTSSPTLESLVLPRDGRRSAQAGQRAGTAGAREIPRRVRDFGCSSQGHRIAYDTLGRCSSMVERPNRSWQMWRSIPSAGPIGFRPNRFPCHRSIFPNRDGIGPTGERWHSRSQFRARRKTACAGPERSRKQTAPPAAALSARAGSRARLDDSCSCWPRPL
jgi:hypothetical protein